MPSYSQCKEVSHLWSTGMKLYDCKGAVNPRRVDIFLAEKGIEIDRVQVNVFGGEHRSDKFRKLNPSCAVPFPMSQSAVTRRGIRAAARRPLKERII